MKTKLLLFLPFFLITCLCMAQRIGLKGGVNIANWDVNPAITNFHPEDFTLMHLGFIYEGRLLGGIHLNTGLFYTEKGYKESFKDDQGNKSDYSWDKYLYMEVPFNLELKTLIAHRSYLFIQGGPYGGYAFMGRAYRYGEYGLIDFERSGLNRYDYGLGFGGGLELGNLVLSVNWQRGLANLNRDAAGSEIKNKILQISIAIMGSAK